jgi:hypothetical protein
MKSRAPSGVGLKRIGVSISRKPPALHRPPDRRDHRAAKSDVALHLRAAQVEPAMAEAQRLVDVLLVELEGQRRRGRDDLQGVDLKLDLAGGDVRVDRLGARGGRPLPPLWRTNSFRIACPSSRLRARARG